MYAQRLGRERAAGLNPYAALLRAGCRSRSAPTVRSPRSTPGAPSGRRLPPHPGHRISARAAFTAHTRGGWRAIGRDDAGVLVPGAPADYAVWRTGELLVQVPDERVAGWSTDPRAGTRDCPTSPRAANSPLRPHGGGRTHGPRTAERVTNTRPYRRTMILGLSRRRGIVRTDLVI
ncbi:amidohydrolase family protein [Streptomyces sp. M19]